MIDRGRSIFGLDDDSSPRTWCNGDDARVERERGTRAHRRRREGVGQIRDADKAVALDEQPTARARGREGLHDSKFIGIDPSRGNAVLLQCRRSTSQAVGLFYFQCDLEGAVTCVLNREGAVCNHTLDEVVVKVEAAPPEFTERA